jgi:hypothetical protein
MNFRRLGRNRVLHLRWLKLGNSRGTVNVFGAALTEGIGDHPLFQGVAKLVVTGLPAKPQLEDMKGVLHLRAQGIYLELKEAQVEFRDTDTIVVKF